MGSSWKKSYRILWINSLKGTQCFFRSIKLLGRSHEKGGDTMKKIYYIPLLLFLCFSFLSCTIVPEEPAGKDPVEEIGEEQPVDDVGEKQPVEDVGEEQPVEDVGEEQPAEDNR